MVLSFFWQRVFLGVKRLRSGAAHQYSLYQDNGVCRGLCSVVDQVPVVSCVASFGVQ